MSRRLWLIVALVVVVFAAGITAGVTVFGKSSSAGAVTLEPVASTGTDPFTSSVSISPVAMPANVQAITAATRKTLSTNPKTHTLVATGTAPGLYGGSGNTHVCDQQQLVGFLQQHPDKAAAWAGVLGITTSNIANYVATLTPVLLTNDTLVTNHGFLNGHATTLQSVLQAGTAVMVDATGTPRVKCNCGNPLTPADPTVTTARLRGTGWPGYTPTQVTVVNAGPVTRSFTLVNITTGDTYTQPAGTAATTPTTSHGPAATTPQGAVATALCPWKDERTGQPNTFSGPAPTSVTLPAGVALPAGATVYAPSADALFVAPAGFQCTATTGDDDSKRVEIVDPANRSRFVEFNGGGSLQNITDGCSYFPQQRAQFARAAVPGESCPTPPASVDYAALPTGDPRVQAAVVAVPSAVLAPYVNGEAGSSAARQHANDVPTLVLFVAGWGPEGAQYVGIADGLRCALPPAQSAMCVASLQLMLENSAVKLKAPARTALQQFLSAHS